MKITWLGQAGLLFDAGSTKIMIDPYLSDSVEKVNPANYRRVPVDRSFFDITPDILICTHNHLDHTDPETLGEILSTQKNITVLAPADAWSTVKAFGKGHNYVLFNRHTQWTERGIRFSAVKAEHSDSSAIGVLLEFEEKIYYITGDTLYHTEIFDDLPGRINTVFLPINGAGNNMNLTDAARFAVKTGAKQAVPIHWGMFDNIDPKKFDFPNKVIPHIYEVIRL